MNGAEQIGADKPIQNPEDLLKKVQGTYRDHVAETPVEQKITMLPQAPQPVPYRLTK